ncbi:MAG: glycosyl hydrolase family 18 protein [bacterium]
MIRRVVTAAVLIISICMPSISLGAKFSYGAWVPYWKKAVAIPDVVQNVNSLKEISPFSYEVQKSGIVRDAMRLTDVSWLTLMETAYGSNIKIIPTFSWQNGDEIHAILSSSTLRTAHIANILRVVDANDFDGIDIDYENKKAETSTYFSKFLTELSKAIHAKKKTLSCTIEARTPPSSRFVTVPKVFEYANDFKVINTVCDEVRIMAYEQGRVDLKLNKTKSASGNYYAPISDSDWVEKVILEALKTIKKEKIMLGIANFGSEYDVRLVNGVSTYTDLRNLSYNEFQVLASTTASKVVRNNAGESGFIYTVNSISSTSTIIGTSTLTNATSTRFVTLSDSKAIQAKITLAKKYKLKGVFLFKIDGESDPNLWSVLK